MKRDKACSGKTRAAKRARETCADKGNRHGLSLTRFRDLPSDIVNYIFEFVPSRWLTHCGYYLDNQRVRESQLRYSFTSAVDGRRIYMIRSGYYLCRNVLPHPACLLNLYGEMSWAVFVRYMCDAQTTGYFTPQHNVHLRIDMSKVIRSAVCVFEGENTPFRAAVPDIQDGSRRASGSDLRWRFPERFPPGKWTLEFDFVPVHSVIDHLIDRDVDVCRVRYRWSRETEEKQTFRILMALLDSLRTCVENAPVVWFAGIAKCMYELVCENIRVFGRTDPHVFIGDNVKFKFLLNLEECKYMPCPEKNYIGAYICDFEDLSELDKDYFDLECVSQIDRVSAPGATPRYALRRSKVDVKNPTWSQFVETYGVSYSSVSCLPLETLVVRWTDLDLFRVNAHGKTIMPRNIKHVVIAICDGCDYSMLLDFVDIPFENYEFSVALWINTRKNNKPAVGIHKRYRHGFRVPARVNKVVLDVCAVASEVKSFLSVCTKKFPAAWVSIDSPLVSTKELLEAKICIEFDRPSHEPHYMSQGPLRMR
jgi:hypothetical protein